MSERYEIRGKLGRGGMSTIYRGFDTVMGREAARGPLWPNGGPSIPARGRGP